MYKRQTKNNTDKSEKTQESAGAAAEETDSVKNTDIKGETQVTYTPIDIRLDVYKRQVVVFVVKFSVLHSVFKLFLSGIAKNLCQRISKINNPYLFSLGWSDDILMPWTIIADTTSDRKALFFLSLIHI